jgi:hypothetical protein
VQRRKNDVDVLEAPAGLDDDRLIAAAPCAVEADLDRDRCVAGVCEAVTDSRAGRE